jgi:cation diffusion facilitator family transporter
VAVLGLIVNIVSVLLLHVQDDHIDDDHDGTAPSHHDHSHHHEHDHNHRAALMHVVADTFTSGLAIAALLAGRFLGWNWLDPVSGVVGGAVILHWGAGLLRNAAFELLDIAASPSVEDQIRVVLEAVDDVRVRDLHVWPIGRGKKSCVVTLTTAAPRPARSYREALARFDLAHLTVEVQRCEDGHEDGTRDVKLLTNIDPNGFSLLSEVKEQGCALQAVERPRGARSRLEACDEDRTCNDCSSDSHAQQRGKHL